MYLPDWIYNLLPWLYLIVGAFAIFNLDSMLGIVCGAFLCGAGAIIWEMRRYNRSDSLEGRHSTLLRHRD